MRESRCEKSVVKVVGATLVDYQNRLKFVWQAL